GPGDLRPIAARTVELLATLARKRSVTLELEDTETSVAAQIDEAQVQQVLANLVVNGLQAMPHGGRLALRLGMRRAAPPPDIGGPPADYVPGRVGEEGPGIAPALLPRIFEPFFTTKEVGEGTGLGLSVAYGIVQEHGGWIEVESRPGEGSRFTIFLRPMPEEALREALG